MVRAKFTCNAIKRQIGSVQNVEGKWVPGEVKSIELSPVYGNGDQNHENTKFWQATPSGQITLSTVNPAAAEQFEIGKEYYVDFTPAS